MPRGNDSRDHTNRKVSREAMWDKHISQQQAMWKGVDAAGIASRVSELDEEAGDRTTNSQDTDEAPAHGIPRPAPVDSAPAHGIKRPDMSTPVHLFPNKSDFIPVAGSFRESDDKGNK